MLAFLRSAREELSKITWLTRKQAIHISWVTVIFITVAMIITAILDHLFSLLYTL